MSGTTVAVGMNLVVPRRRRARATVGAVALGAGLACAITLVVLSAAGPSALAPGTLHAGMPRWLAGPLGGLGPEFARRPESGLYWFSGVLGAMTLLWAVALWCAGAVRLRVAAAAVVALHLVLLLGPPLPLTDVFNYLNYARMGVLHGLNPYVRVPATHLEYTHDPAGAFSHWHHMRTAYGPLFTLASYPLALLPVPVALWTFKSAVLAADLGAVALVATCARRLGRPVVLSVLLVGFSPVAMVWGVGGEHNDSFMVVLILGAVALWLAEREGWAAALMVAAGGIKVSALFLLPLLLVGARDRRVALRGALVAGVAMAAASVAAFGTALPNLGQQARLVTPWSVPNLVGLLVGAGGETRGVRIAAFAVLGVCVALATWRVARGAPWITAAAWVSLAMLLTIGSVLPWYLMWLAPLAALAGSRALRAVTVALAAYLLVTWAPGARVYLRELPIRPGATPTGRANDAYVVRLLR